MFYFIRMVDTWLYNDCYSEFSEYALLTFKRAAPFAASTKSIFVNTPIVLMPDGSTRLLALNADLKTNDVSKLLGPQQSTFRIG